MLPVSSAPAATPAASETRAVEDQAGRWLFADVLRCAGTLAVIGIHSCYKLFYMIGELPLDRWLAINFWESCARWAVPVFFMLSGMLLLGSGREESLRTLLLRRLPRLLVPLLLWSEVYLLWINRENIVNRQPFSFVEGLKWMYKTNVFLHLWFLYALIGIYLSIPVVRYFSRAATPAQKWFFVAGWFLFNGVLGVVEFFQELKFGISVPVFNLYLGYFVLGAWLPGVAFSRPQRRLLYAGLGLSVAGIFYGTYWLRQHGYHLELFYEYWAPPVMLSAVGLFAGARALPWQRWLPAGSGRAKLLREISGLTFGVYLSHVLVLEMLSEGWWFPEKITANSVHPLLGIPLLSLFVFVVCLVLAKGLRAVPGLRWLAP